MSHIAQHLTSLINKLDTKYTDPFILRLLEKKKRFRQTILEEPDIRI